jgi:hypothetical protein
MHPRSVLVTGAANNTHRRETRAAPRTTAQASRYMAGAREEVRPEKAASFR